MSSHVWIVDRRDGVPVGRAYVISCQCMNCGMAHVALFNKGQAAKRQPGLCPFCECEAELVYRTTSEAFKGMVERSPVILVEREGGYEALKEKFDMAKVCAHNPRYDYDACTVPCAAA